MRVAIVQPNYIPWRGYFDFISQVDLFIFYDDVQYTKQDWRNRNQLRAKNGDLIWLSVPVNAKMSSLIMDVEIDYTQNWTHKQLSFIEQNYGSAPFFKQYYEPFRDLLLSKIPLLSDLDIALSKMICDWLGIKTAFVKASDLACSGAKDQRLIDLMQKVGGDHYLSGPAARSYIQPSMWEKAGLCFSYIEYPNYPAYAQIAEPFEPRVSIMDLLFMTGPEAPKYIWENSMQRRRE